MPKKHSDDSGMAQLAKELHLRLAVEYGHPVDFVLMAVDNERPYYVDITTNSKDSQLFNVLLKVVNETRQEGRAFVVPKGGHA
jgi:hypothetical protein